jgi:phosphoglycolate phosphatase
VTTARAALFDLDGTLVDSAADITFSKNAVLARLGRPEVGIEEVRPWIGLPPADFFAHLGLGLEAPEAVLDFRAHLAEHVGTFSTVYEGVSTALESLSANGWRLGVATNKPTALARIALERAGLLGYFEVVHGPDDRPPKPDPAILHACLATLDCPGGVMVGDTVVDIRAAKAAGVTSVLVTHHVEPSSALSEARPDVTVASFSELIDRLGAL